MSRKTNTKSRSYPIVLKSIIRDAHDENKAFALNDKQIRARLRVAFRDTHAMNTSWVANNAREYDALRSTFDATYRERIANAKKRTTKKRDAKSNDATATNEIA